MTEKMKTIFDLIMRINEETEFAAFMHIHGHVNSIVINVCKDKEKLYTVKIYEARLHYAGQLQHSDSEFNEIIINLKEILEVQ